MRRSAWEALAELPKWDRLTPIPLGLPLVRSEPNAGGLIVTDLTPVQLDDLKLLLARLQQLWHIRADPNYAWRGFKAERFALQLRDEVVALIDKILSRIDKVTATAEQYAGKIGIKVSPQQLVKIGELLDHRPGLVPASWLKEVDWARLADDLATCSERYQTMGQARAPLTEKYGPSLWALAPGTAAKVEEAWHNAAQLLAPGDDRGAALLAGQQKLRAWAADTIKRVPGWIAEIRTLEKWLAVPLPSGAGAETFSRPAAAGESRLDPSLHALRRLLRLGNLCLAEAAPERPWIPADQALKEAEDLIAVNRPIFAHYHERRRRLLEKYQESFFELDLEGMAKGFAGPYLSWLRIFNGQFRRDRRAIKRRTRHDIFPDSVAEDVMLGRELMTEKAKLEAAAPERRAILGRYERGLDTDWELAERATKVARESLQLARQLGCSSLPARLVDALCATTPPADKIRAGLKRLNDSVAAWQHGTQELQTLLPTESVPEVGEELDECALSALVNLARVLQAALNLLGGLTEPLLARSPTTPVDLATLAGDLHKAEELLAWEASQETETPRWTARFGEGFRGIDTNWDGLRKELTWARRLRECLKDAPPTAKQTPALTELPVPPESFIGLVTSAGPMPTLAELKHAHEQFEQAVHHFESRFDAPGPLLEGKRLMEQPPTVLRQHFTRLRKRVGELSDWIDYRHLPDRFAHLGLRGFWDRLQEDPPAPNRSLTFF